MATAMLVLIVAFLTITITPWIANMRHTKVHHTDLMAGDEGEE